VIAGGGGPVAAEQNGALNLRVGKERENILAL